MGPRSLFLAVVFALVLILAPAAAAQPPFLQAWGSKGTDPGQFRTPDGISVDSAGRVFVADQENDRVQVFSADGTLLNVITNGLKRPYGVAADDRGSVYVLDTDNDRIQELTAAGVPVRTWGSKGKGDGQLDDPRGIGVGPDGTVYVADHDNNRVDAFAPDGTFIRKWGRNGGDGSAGSGPGEFDQPRGIATDPTGAVYVVEKNNHRVQKFTADGQFVTAFGGLGTGDGQLQLPYNAAVDQNGTLYVADVDNQRVDEFGLDGTFRGRFGTQGAGPGQFDEPYAVAVDCRGGLYVTDENNARVQRFADPAAPFPACAPTLRVGSVHAGRRAATVQATCDRACSVYATATVRMRGARSSALKAGTALDVDRPGAVKLAYPARVRRAVAAGRARLTVRVAALGTGGAAPTVVRHAGG
jgi:DNA-binding beta-propeller fold protein YncE